MAALLHETAHQLLFGLSLDQPVVENDVEERYASPLRPDPRPMDGIFHATFVCARMRYGYVRLDGSQTVALDYGDRTLVLQRQRNTAANFLMGSRRSNTTDIITANGDRILTTRNGLCEASSNEWRAERRASFPPSLGVRLLARSSEIHTKITADIASLVAERPQGAIRTYDDHGYGREISYLELWRRSGRYVRVKRLRTLSVRPRRACCPARQRCHTFR